MKIELNEYKIKNSSLKEGTVFALVSDLHSEDPVEIVRMLGEMSPNYILAPGDILEVMDGSCDEKNENGFNFLRACAGIAPTFYSLGNHEMGGTGSWHAMGNTYPKKEKKMSPENAEKLAATGVIFLNDAMALRDGIAFFGLSSGLVRENCVPNLETMERFLKYKGAKVLLSHHPEYYPKYFADSDIDLMVSGHAHGGQWRLFGRGIFAPGQGFFPKYTSGVYGDRFIISRGLKKHSRVPRIFNPPEVIKITVTRG